MSKIVIVDKLDPSITKEELLQFFSKVGNVEEIDLQVDKFSENLQNIAFITFSNSNMASKCVQEMNGIRIRNTILRIKFGRRRNTQNHFRNVPVLPYQPNTNHFNFVQKPFKPNVNNNGFENYQPIDEFNNSPPPPSFQKVKNSPVSYNQDLNQFHQTNMSSLSPLFPAQNSNPLVDENFFVSRLQNKNSPNENSEISIITKYKHPSDPIQPSEAVQQILKLRNTLTNIINNCIVNPDDDKVLLQEIRKKLTRHEYEVFLPYILDMIESTHRNKLNLANNIAHL